MKLILESDIVLDDPPPKNICKGLYFRGRVSSYWDRLKLKITTRKELKLLKRQSCSGCLECGWMYEYFNEDVNYHDITDYIGDIERGEIYYPKFHTSQGFEDLYPEIDSVEFIKVKKRSDE